MRIPRFCALYSSLRVVGMRFGTRVESGILLQSRLVEGEKKMGTKKKKNRGPAGSRPIWPTGKDSTEDKNSIEIGEAECGTIYHV